MPAPHTLTYVSRMNNHGQIVGYMTAANGERRGYLYDPSFDPDTAIDLNDIAVGIPDGWKIAKASGINDHGILVGDLSPVGGTENIRQAFTLDTNLPAPVVIPIGPALGDWSITSGSDINEDGDIFGYVVGDDDLKYAFLYNPGDPATPLFLSAPIRTSLYAGYLNNPLQAADGSITRPAQVAGRLDDGAFGGSGTPFRWTTGVALETFPALNSPLIFGINDAGTMCGSVFVQQTSGSGKKKSTTSVEYPIRLATSTPQILSGAPGRTAPDINSTADTLISGNILYRDDWAAYGSYVNIAQLLIGTDAEKAQVASAGALLMNDRDPFTSASQLAGKGFLLTPLPAP